MSRTLVTRSNLTSTRTGVYDYYGKGTDGTLLDSFTSTSGVSLISGNALSLDTTVGHFPNNLSAGVQLTSYNNVVTTIEKSVNWNLSSIQNLCFYIYIQAGDSSTYPQDFATYVNNCTGLLLSTTGGFTGSDSYFTWPFQATRYMSGLYKVLIDKSEFTAVNGALWSSPITRIRLQGLAQPSYTVSITYSNFVMNDIKKPTFIFTLDDLHLSQYQNAIPVLEKYGFRCSLAFVSNWCAAGANGNIPTMNLSQVKELYNKGHEVFNHTSDHTSTYDPVNGLSIFNACKSYMQSNGLTGSENIIAYPSGNVSQSAISTYLANGYTWGRTVTYEPITGITPLPVAQQLLLKSAYICTGNDGVSTQIDPPTTLAMAKTMVDDTIANGHTCLFTFHGIVPDPTTISNYYWGNLWRTDNFTSLVQYIFGYTSTGQAQVMRYGDWIKGMQGRQTTYSRTIV